MGTKAICKCTMWGEEIISFHVGHLFVSWKQKAICKCTKWINFFSYGPPFVVWKQMRIRGAQCKDVKQILWTIFSCWFSICIMETKAMHNVNMWNKFFELFDINYMCEKKMACQCANIINAQHQSIFFA
jgi:hypothetical protein